MGVCFTGGDNKSEVFWFAVLPLLISAVTIAVFLPLSIYRLWTTISSDSHGDMSSLWHFHVRLCAFLIGVVGSWMSLFSLVVWIWRRQNAVISGSEDRLICAALKGLQDYDSCYSKGTRMPPWLLIWVAIGVVTATFSSMILGCREKALDVWEMWIPFLSPLFRCNGKSFEENRTAREKSGKIARTASPRQSEASQGESSKSGKRWWSKTKSVSMDDGVAGDTSSAHDAQIELHTMPAE
jgi:hypothetical protein